MSAPLWAVEGRDWPNRARSRFVAAGRLRWHVQTFGAEDAPVVLLLHGTGAATHSWRALAPLLAAHYHVLAIDLPGHGFTAGRPIGGLSMPAMAMAIAELLSTLERAPTVIVGHSAGAAIALRLTLDGLAAPTAIVGLSAALLPFPGLAAQLFPTLARALFVNPLAPHLFARLARTPGETARFLQRSTGSRIDAEGVRCYEKLFATSAQCAGAIGMMAAWDLAALKRDLPRLPTPLLLMHGTADAAIPLANAREAAALVGNGRLETFAGLGHLAHEERPAEIAARIQAFMGER
ncbi:alpha/beta fold hydrolase BchO [Sphingomonas sp. PB4P5]|uniref:alpha/beta fold hydrolase BchO n=1 Tax=Parasphingomonas puruogangriensis TaxID=3096155 RepID=UPI002FC890C3